MIDAEKEDNETSEEEEGCIQERGQYLNRPRKVQFVDAWAKNARIRDRL
jgi:hypothetical protein